MKKGILNGFTLLEMLIALAILSVIAYIMAFSFVSIRRASEWGVKNDRARRNIVRLTEDFDREFSSIYYKTSSKRTVFVSTRRAYQDAMYNSVRFTFIDPLSPYETGKRDELVEVYYNAGVDEQTGKIVLEKRIWYLSKNPDRLSTGEPDVSIKFTEKFDYFKMEFYKRGKWFDSWDTEKTKDIPDMIKIEFSVNGKKYREIFNVFISRF